MYKKWLHKVLGRKTISDKRERVLLTMWAETDYVGRTELCVMRSSVLKFCVGVKCQFYGLKSFTFNLRYMYNLDTCRTPRVTGKNFGPKLHQ